MRGQERLQRAEMRGRNTLPMGQLAREKGVALTAHATRFAHSDTREPEKEPLPKKGSSMHRFCSLACSHVTIHFLW
jgi:hypothetical protein